jgi:hypothetical protein
LKRLALAFLVAPVLPAMAQAWTINLAGEYHPLARFIVICGALYNLQLIVGVPAYLVFRRVKQAHLWAYALLGFGAAAVPLLCMFLYLCATRECRLAEPFRAPFQAGLLGATTAVIFWLIVRPDRVALRSIAPSD